MFDVDHAV